MHDPILDPLVLKYQVGRIFPGHWGAEEAVVRERIASVLPLIAEVDPGVGALLIDRYQNHEILPFGSRFVVVGPHLLSIPLSESGDDFTQWARLRHGQIPVEDLPRENGLYDRLRRIDRTRRWWPVRGAFLRDGPVCLGHPVSRTAVALAHTLAHEGKHAQEVDPSHATISEERRNRLERSALTVEKALNTKLRILLSQGLQAFGTLQQLDAELERIDALLPTVS